MASPLDGPLDRCICLTGYAGERIPHPYCCFEHPRPIGDGEACEILLAHINGEHEELYDTTVGCLAERCEEAFWHFATTQEDWSPT